MSKKDKEKLGKGLKAIFNNYDQLTTPRTSAQQEAINAVNNIPVDQIVANPYQPRKTFSPEELEELAESIQTHGLIQPITVRRLGVDQYQLISGERRWRAAQKAGIAEVPAYIREADQQGMIEMALIENIQREDLNPLEVAFAYQQLMDEAGLTQEAMATRVSKKRSTIANYLRLLTLPPEIQKSLKEERLTMGHARVLAGVKSLPLQLELHRAVLRDGLSVRALERKAQTPASPASSNHSKELSPEMLAVQDRLSEMMGTKVRISTDRRGAGKLVIPFDNTEALNALLDLLGY